MSSGEPSKTMPKEKMVRIGGCCAIFRYICENNNVAPCIVHTGLGIIELEYTPTHRRRAACEYAFLVLALHEAYRRHELYRPVADLCAMFFVRPSCVWQAEKQVKLAVRNRRIIKPSSLLFTALERCFIRRTLCSTADARRKLVKIGRLTDMLFYKLNCSQDVLIACTLALSFPEHRRALLSTAKVTAALFSRKLPVLLNFFKQHTSFLDPPPPAPG